MTTSTITQIKPNDKAIREYYKTLADYAAVGATHEGAVSTAFSELLRVTASKTRQWTLIPQEPVKSGGRTVRPDGVLQDQWDLRYGFWEAKDTRDDLEKEIGKKIKAGYPLMNTIFEDTRTGVLYQNGEVAFRADDLSNKQQLADLLNAFFSYTKPNYEDFEQAVAQFQEVIPRLANGLNKRIKEAHASNRAFKTAYAKFFELCQQSLNPNISPDAVDEMLIQHLLTERLIRTVFENPDFRRRNVIANEIETVIDALTSQAFNRAAFLGQLDRFYVAIEGAARDLGDDFSAKQHFLNTVYERFFQGYSVKVADTHGIVYTPQEIVDFMCAAVEEVLQSEFGLGLGDEGVNILDPATGTGNFIINLLHRVPRQHLERVYKQQLFANEVMLLPYYVAALNIEHAYHELAGVYAAFEGLSFVDTLDLAESRQMGFAFISEANTERVERQKKTPITVIIGNPPYNVGQLNENDNNKNRKYAVVDKQVKETYARASKASNKNALYDAYVKFFRWATDRLNGRDGIVCYVTNNSFVDQIAFDGMRNHLLQDFTTIYHIDLHGNVRQNPKLSGTTHNVFGIQVGVGITIAIRSANHSTRELFYHRVPENWRKEEKLSWLAQQIQNPPAPLKTIKWRRLTPDKRHTWLTPEHAGEFGSFIPIGSKAAKSARGLDAETIFKNYGRGVATSRDVIAYDFHRNILIPRIKQFVEDYNAEVDRYRRTQNPGEVDDFVRYDKVNWSRDLKLDLERGNYAEYADSKIRLGLYRPFTQRSLFFDRILNEEVYVFPAIFPTPAIEQENRVIALTDRGSEKPFMMLVTNRIADLHLVGAGSSAQCFPFYVYDEDGGNRRENVTDWALKQFRGHYGDETIDKWDIFYYVYGLLHHPGYRERYGDNLKRDLPRIPFAPDFAAFAGAGRRLARLHLDYEQVGRHPLTWVIDDEQPLSYRVEKMRLSRDKTTLKVNETLTLGGIPPGVYDYRLGNRSALEWVIDQYQVKTDKRSGIVSDPNRAEEKEYIVHLVERVVAVSLQTVAIVDGLPEDFGGGE